MVAVGQMGSGNLTYHIFAHGLILELVKVKRAKVRTRVCTPPVNGGAPCDALGPAEEECDSLKCAGENDFHFFIFNNMIESSSKTPVLFLCPIANF